MPSTRPAHYHKYSRWPVAIQYEGFIDMHSPYANMHGHWRPYMELHGHEQPCMAVTDNGLIMLTWLWTSPGHCGRACAMHIMRGHAHTNFVVSPPFPNPHHHPPLSQPPRLLATSAARLALRTFSPASAPGSQTLISPALLHQAPILPLPLILSHPRILKPYKKRDLGPIGHSGSKPCTLNSGNT